MKTSNGMKICYLANIRLPTGKAHGLATMKMCEAFALQGNEVLLVVPRRFHNLSKENPFRHYEMEESFSIVKLPTLDFVRFGKIGFWIQALSFAVCAFWYILFKKLDIIYGRDELSLSYLSFFKKDVVWESHTAKKKCFVSGLLKRSKKLVVISRGLKEHYVSFGIPEEKILVAPSGVDLDVFKNIKESKEELRKKINLPINKKIIAYVGKLKTMGEEKGVGELDQVIGEVKKNHPEAELLIVSKVKPHEAPAYMKAVDILVMNYPNMEHYARYMSPLKMFEYMASENPIVATDLPSIREILDESTAYLFNPDDSKGVTKQILEVLEHYREAQSKAVKAAGRVKEFTWKRRADNIIAFISDVE